MVTAAWPDLPRACTPDSFMRTVYPRLAAALKPAPTIALPVPLTFEIELRDVYRVTLQRDGAITLETEMSRTADAPCVVLEIDEPAFQSLYELLGEWHRRRTKAGDQDQLRAWLAGLAARYGDRLPALVELARTRPATIEVGFRDLAGDEQSLTVEIGEPGDDDPCLRLSFSLGDVPLDPHRAGDAALQALFDAKARVTGDTTWLAAIRPLVTLRG